MDEAAIRRACCYAPEDDAPRLVLCDWLEERGRVAEALLIRRMVYAPTYTFTWNRRSRHGNHVHAETRKAITGLKGTFEALYRDRWQLLPDVERITVRRGFIESITTSASPFLDHAKAFFEWHPITDVHFTDIRARYAFEQPGCFKAHLAEFPFVGDYWPAVMFDEYPAWKTLYWTSREKAERRLSPMEPPTGDGWSGSRGGRRRARRGGLKRSGGIYGMMRMGNLRA